MAANLILSARAGVVCRVCSFLRCDTILVTLAAVPDREKPWKTSCRYRHRPTQHAFTGRDRSEGCFSTLLRIDAAVVPRT